jgi:hypothetical protein
MADYAQAARNRLNRYMGGGRSYGPQQTPSPISIGGGGVNFPLDQEAIQEISDIRTQAAIDLAEYQQRVANAGSEAAAQRGQVSRQMGISSDAAARGSSATNDIFNTLMGNYGDIAPRYEADYNAGAEQTRRGYQDARQNLAYGMIEGNNREAELAAMAGGQFTGPQEQYDAPVGAYDALLAASGSAGSEAMRVMGQAETGYQRAAVPGSGQERDQLVSDINLERDAELSDLRNQLAQIQPAFVPFNGAQMQFDTERAIREAIMGSREREQEQGYQGRQGLARFAAEQGRPDLLRFFNQSQLSASSGTPVRDAEGNPTGDIIPPEMALAQAINGYQATVRGIPERIATGRTVTRNGGGGFLGNNPIGNAISGLLGDRRTSREMRTNPAYQRAVEEASSRDRELLQQMLDIYNGNY